MQDAIRKAATLVEALPYIQRFRGKVVVIKLGGAAMDLEGGVSGVLPHVRQRSLFERQPRSEESSAAPVCEPLRGVPADTGSA